MRKRVVVTGLGAVAPNGVGVPAFREALKAGRSGISRHEELKELNFACQIGGIPPTDEDAILKVLPEADYHKMSEAMIYAVLAAVECAKNSGASLDSKNYQNSPVDWNSGAIMGCGIGGMDTIFQELAPVMAEAKAQEPGRGTIPMGADIVPKVMNSSVSVAVGRFLGLGGQTSSNSSACNTGTEAIFEAWKHIQMGFAESMYAGGAEGTHFGIWAGFDAMRDVLCSRFNEAPEKGSQPMGAGACGFVPAGGAGVLRLETLESAQKRGAEIICELISAFCNSGGQRDGGTMTFPNPDGVTRCIRRVIEDSGVSPDRISLINGHLTSTGADPREIASWMKALELPPEKFPLIQSTKSMIGHCLGAAGALECVAAADQLANGYVHPSINSDEIHPQIAKIGNSIPRQARQARLEYVIKASFGFGDVNGCLLFKRWDGK
ncbi:MAG TPA: beta-ketoacyl-[acyl-carrier-protein] synthase family protein [Elusimicrobiota bacterium]|nr:beta-ketoacyl-[acyl-carrier-protein] synthase family protein [Elusimicrobiota bacterium]